ncbi:Lar family restriction alleviation protein [Pseudomonas aeruginosa]|uniref:Lar family restriction alleviation protein n=1 Tax=Pseudomonas aeruginosa TaxID=287 RepID=UPI000F8184DA|nr:Lar family restriction alleviation protein [Pseudomonas aeruginosa]RTX05133.1 restriction alleviation protein, Lar family [Pseudomonas aeruginosa]HBP0026007.1 restriction alleviation protein, Lar family [Pseudomonas aeruginosa]
MSELKSCPMCGGAAFVGPLTRKRWFCECEECGVSMISQNDKQHAIDQWNRRSIPADQVLVPRELLERIRSQLDLRAEFDWTYPPETQPENDDARLYLELRALLSEGKEVSDGV